MILSLIAFKTLQDDGSHRLTIDAKKQDVRSCLRRGSPIHDSDAASRPTQCELPETMRLSTKKGHSGVCAGDCSNLL